jgi:hypothetical protein
MGPSNVGRCSACKTTETPSSHEIYPNQLALTTACLTVPAVVLWRQRPRTNVRSLSTASVTASSAPPRRSVASRWKYSPPVGRAEESGVAVASTSTSHPPPRRTSGPIKINSTQSKPHSPSLDDTPQSSTTRPSTAVLTGAAPTQSFFDGPVAGLGAFGIATFVVGLGATLGVWCVQRSMGVQNVSTESNMHTRVADERLCVQ